MVERGITFAEPRAILPEIEESEPVMTVEEAKKIIRKMGHEVSEGVAVSCVISGEFTPCFEVLVKEKQHGLPVAFIVRGDTGQVEQIGSSVEMNWRRSA